MTEIRIGFPGHEKTVSAEIPPGAPVPWGLDAALDVVGRDHPRVDALAKVTGRARYSYDVRPKNLAYAGLVVSPHAHARVRRVDVAKAKALPGVLLVEPLEGSTVRFAGQHVCGVVAETEEILDDALAAIEVDYEVLPHAVTIEDAMKEGAPLVKNDGNVQRSEEGDAAAAERLHAEADVVIERVYRTQVQTHSALEPHGCVCAWEGDRLTCWSSTQGTFSVQQELARALEIPVGNVTVITEHMGGGFGAKFGTRWWDLFCARAARALGRPVRMMLDRRQEHLAGGNRPNSVQRCKFSAMKDGTLVAAEVHSHGTGGIAGGANVANPSVYSFRGRYKETTIVYTHAGEGRAFRAPGHPQGFFALEGMIDELAEAIGMDPLELRRRNDRNEVRLAQYEIGAKEIGWERRRNPAGSDKGPRKRGLGMASARWGHTGGQGARVLCRAAKDGSVLVANGAQDLGTGTRTVLAVIAAEELGLEPSRIDVRLGHTTDPVGPGSGGSTTASTVGPAARDAAFQVKRQILAAVSSALGVAAEGLDLKGGRVTGAPKAVTFEQACALLPQESVEALGQWSAGTPFGRFNNEVAGVQFAEVEVDVETGKVRVVKVVAVQDCGRVVDPLLARSQINGGVIQGVSYALFEERLLDAKSGDMVNANLLDYRILGSLDMPEIVAIPFSVVNGINNVGMSSLGEPPTVPTAGAVANAVANAIGARVRSLPITPDKVLAALGGI